VRIYTAHICFEKRAKFARECEGEVCAEYALYFGIFRAYFDAPGDLNSTLWHEGDCT
jgi:hypothetical protein